MRLFLESGDEVASPTDLDIADRLPGEEFAILSDSHESLTYLQFAEHPERPWELLLEYQDGSLDEHFEATDAPIAIERVVLAFQKYARGDASWRADFTWVRVSIQ